MLPALSLLLSGSEGLVPGTVGMRHAARCDTAICMGSPAAYEKKQKVVDALKQEMESATLMFAARSEGIPVNAMNKLRMEFEDIDGATVMCAKNTLVKRAAEDYPHFMPEDSLTKYSNLWFFAKEESMRPAVEKWGAFVKEISRAEENGVRGGIFDGSQLDGKGVVQISKLPTKQELMGTTAALVKAVPTKLGKAIKQAQGQKLVRAVKLVADQKEEA